MKSPQIISVILVIALSFVSQQAHSQNYRFKNFGLEEGLPQSQVYDVIQDQKGFLWVGTRGGGVARFDGSVFTNFQTKQGLINNFVNQIYEDKSGLLWIGTEAGLSIFDGKDFKNIRLTKAGDVRVFCFLEHETSMLIGTSNGIYQYHYKDSKLSKVSLPSTDQTLLVLDFAKTQEFIWVATNRGLFQLHKTILKTIKHYTKSTGLPDNYVQCLHADTSNRLWIGTYGAGIVRWQDGEIKHLNLLLPHNLIVFDLTMEGPHLWLATLYRGAYKINTQTGDIQNFTDQKGLINNHIRSISQDRWGSVWLGSSGGGLSQYSGQRFYHYSAQDGLADNYVYSIAQDKKGGLWLGTGSQGLTKLDSSGIYKFGGDTLFKNIKIKTIASLNDSTMVMGTEGYGLAFLTNNAVTWLTMRDGLCGNYIKDVEVDKDGHLWVASLDGGLSKVLLQKGKPRFVNYQYLTELPTNRIFSLHVDALNQVWFGTENRGLGVIRDGAAIMIESKPSLGLQTIRAIRTDQRGKVWLATSEGLFKYNPNQNTLERMAINELRSNNLYLLEFDSDGKLYVGSEKGIDQLLLNESSEAIEINFYGYDEGFIGIETCQNSVLLDQQNKLWFGTVNGLTRLNPNWVPTAVFPPDVWLSGVDLFYEHLDSGQYGYSADHLYNVLSSPEFPHNKNHLSFSLTGLYLSNPAKVKYRWKLEGNDESWSPFTHKKDATYSNLKPGSFTFFFQTQTDDGMTSAVKKWDFTIRAPFWQEWWFRALAIALALLLLIGLFRWYVLRIKQREAQQREKLAIEKEIIELEQKALRLQMNPHFMFNALNSIQSLVAGGKPDEARGYLQKFAKLMRLTLQNSRADYIPLSDEIEVLENYLDLEKLAQKDPFSYTVNIGEGVEANNVLIPPMMIQPFVENAIKHGVPDKGLEGLIELSFSINNEEILECSIKDNGIGREKAAEKVRSKAKSHESTAIQVTSERLAILNREHPGNGLTINDLVDGTEVVVSIYVG
ncbi:MAG: ligand-binding sensor domain-containing protein/two-component sensor histidine kinase [Bacteroidia bacterium]|jgi:ligand-binding sensor domain-containing protein/two-component sensor histidine kinase